MAFGCHGAGRWDRLIGAHRFLRFLGLAFMIHDRSSGDKLSQYARDASPVPIDSANWLRFSNREGLGATLLLPARSAGPTMGQNSARFWRNIRGEEKASMLQRFVFARNLGLSNIKRRLAASPSRIADCFTGIRRVPNGSQRILPCLRRALASWLASPPSTLRFSLRWDFQQGQAEANMNFR